MWYCIIWQVDPDVLKDHDASIYRVQWCKKSDFLTLKINTLCPPKGSHCSPQNTVITSRNTETLSNTAGRTSNSLHLLESKSCGFHPVLLYICNIKLHFSIKMEFTSAMVVVFEYGFIKRASNLWPASTKRALNALIPCRHPMSSGDLERLNSVDTFLRRENACTSFLLVP